MRIRQIALLATNLELVRQQIFGLLGLHTDFRDPFISTFGLHNSVVAIGDTFLEIVSPATANTSAERLLHSRGGDGGYMVLTQVDDLDIVSARMTRLGVRKVWEIDIPDEVRAFHLHPKDVPGAICSFDEMTPPQSWKWGGPNWVHRRAEHVSGIAGAEIQSERPEVMARQWSRVFALPAEAIGEGYKLRLRRGEIRFITDSDGRGDGLSGIDLVAENWAAIAEAADQLGLPRDGRMVEVCGTKFHFL